MQPEQPLIAPTLMGRGGDTALGMEQRSPEQRPPSAASPRAAVQVVMLQPLLAAASVPLYAGPIQWMGQLAGPISGFVGGGTLPAHSATGGIFFSITRLCTAGGSGIASRTLPSLRS